MVLFPLAVIWLIVVIVWVVRNQTAPPEERAWARWRPRPPRTPPRGRPHGSPDRSGGRRASAGTTREPH
jgi:hypothetical protein